MKLEIVTAEKIEEYFDQYNKIKNKNVNEITIEDRYSFADEILEKIFNKEDFDNNDLAIIYKKVVLLNSLYSTNIYSTFDVALHIKNNIKNFKNRIESGDPTIVPEIANVKIKNVKINFYSFATKYCHHHNDNKYPIYDKFVCLLLKEYSKIKEININIKGNNLKDYTNFRMAIDNFCKYFNLPEKLKYRKVDKYLWQKGKEIIKYDGA